MKYLNNIYIFFSPLLYFIGVCLLISSFQWSILMIYNYYCLDKSMLGFFTNIFTLGSPICNAMNRIQSTLSDYYITYIGIGILGLISWINGFLKISL